MEKKIEVKDTVIHTTRVKLSYRDRIRALFGRQIVTTSWIDVDQVVMALSSRAQTYVEHIRPPKPMPGEVEMKRAFPIVAARSTPSKTT